MTWIFFVTLLALLGAGSASANTPLSLPASLYATAADGPGEPEPGVKRPMRLSSSDEDDVSRKYRAGYKIPFVSDRLRIRWTPVRYLNEAERLRFCCRDESVTPGGLACH